MKKIDRDIYELGETEREAARGADFARPGGLFYRIFKLIERIAESERKALIEKRDEERARERQS